MGVSAQFRTVYALRSKPKPAARRFIPGTNAQMNLIETPYGKKAPETLCRAMDALERERDLLDALQAVCDAYGDSDTLLMAQVRAALAKAQG